MKENDKNDHLDKDEEAQVKEEKNLNLKKMLIWILSLGILFSIIAWVGGFITVGGPDKGGRFGTLQPEDSSAIVRSDTIKVE